MGRGNGAQGRSRTADTAIFSRMLYQLSYLGAVRRNAPNAERQASESSRLIEKLQDAVQRFGGGARKNMMTPDGLATVGQHRFSGNHLLTCQPKSER